ncbi:MAG: ATP-binding cassette domain-containing protein [Candidatus Abyssobacteria bacterium SURF_17]|uniref:ATP-binding cassette domain-containing protein n=1 Tax=Candidatus Abyssobacteria bacterium SURF_17 TaxID=2093361 RepID=A0A419ETZ9_9BACT|nr:MAG: ATP-binding cassette domain-containing protein [Candidatus Abyssubacteria bacterium SURF_17]
MIEVENLTKYYGQVQAIKDVSFTVDRGEILGFLGPNGAGKTTTMRILTCFIPATSGTARVAGYDVFSQSLEVRRRIGYLPERVPLYKDMTVDSYLGFVAGVKGVPSKACASKIEEVKASCGIEDISGRLIGKLSRGYTQRVGIAQALLNDPEVLILDEPTVGLDPKQIIEIRNLIRNLAGKRTIILSTHILPEVSMICDSVAIINEGRIVAKDSLSHLASERQLTVNLTVTGPAEKVFAAISNVEGVESVEGGEESPEGVQFEVKFRPGADQRAKLAAAIVQNGWDLAELHAERPSLEDIFIRATAKEAEVES